MLPARDTSCRDTPAMLCRYAGAAATIASATRAADAAAYTARRRLMMLRVAGEGC